MDSTQNTTRLPFLSRIFLIAVTFKMFYVEIALLLQMPIKMTSSKMWSWMMISCLFLLILIIGFYLESNQESLEWSK